MSTSKTNGCYGCSSDQSCEANDCVEEELSAGNASKQSANSKSVAKAGKHVVNAIDGYSNFLEKFSIYASKAAVRTWEKMTDSQRALFRGKDTSGQGSKKKSCANPRKARPKPKNSVNRRYSKQMCPKPRAPKSKKPKTATKCSKPISAKKLPKAKPAHDALRV